MILKNFDIDRVLIVRRRSERVYKSAEIWCLSRKTAVEMIKLIKPKARKLKMHVSLGTNFSDRRKNMKPKVALQSIKNTATLASYSGTQDH